MFTEQELKDLLDALDHAYIRVEDALTWIDVEDEEALEEQLTRFEILEDKINEMLKGEEHERQTD